MVVLTQSFLKPSRLPENTRLMISRWWALLLVIRHDGLGRILQIRNLPAHARDNRLEGVGETPVDGSLGDDDNDRALQDCYRVDASDVPLGFENRLNKI